VYQGGALSPADLEYSYDLAGRRVGVSGSLANTQLPSAISLATYNANNQLTQWGSTGMSYDLDGNTLNDGMNSYVWDARNRLISADSSGATFAYDPLGRRTAKTMLGTSTSFLYDGVNPVQELNGATVTANLLTGRVDERFLRTTASETDNFLTDVLGSTVGLTGSTGTTTVQYSYAPFGAVSISGSTTNSFTYTGREMDGLGVNYYRARYYNPAIGRFISEDPIGFLGGVNEYAYVEDDPSDFVDPLGRDKWSFFDQWLKDVKSCFIDTGLGTIASDMNPFTPSSTNSAQQMIDQAAQSSALAAGAYTAQRMLPYPLKSSAVRAAFAGVDFGGSVGWVRQIVARLNGAEALGKISGWITIAQLYYAIGDAYSKEWKKCGWS
jgi:RHS repeat-associated protein